MISASRAVTTENVRVVADLRIARGLDYYTGTVVEIYMEGFEHLKAVGGGGRYDALATDGKTTYPGVGISFGVSRSVVPLVAKGLLATPDPCPAPVLVALVSEEERQVSIDLAGRLRSRGIACEVAPSATPFGKQIRFADRRSIPFVVFPGVGGGGPPGEGHPLRRAGGPRPGVLGTRRRVTCDRRSSPATEGQATAGQSTRRSRPIASTIVTACGSVMIARSSVTVAGSMPGQVAAAQVAARSGRPGPARRRPGRSRAACRPRRGRR